MLPAEHSGRRVVRARKVSQRVGQVSAAERENVRNARLDALENDDAGGNAGVTGDSDEEYVLQDSDDGAAERLPACTMHELSCLPACDNLAFLCGNLAFLTKKASVLVP